MFFQAMINPTKLWRMGWKGPDERQGDEWGLSESLKEGIMVACTMTVVRGRELLQSKANLKK